MRTIAIAAVIVTLASSQALACQRYSIWHYGGQPACRSGHVHLASAADVEPVPFPPVKSVPSAPVAPPARVASIPPPPVAKPAIDDETLHREAIAKLRDERRMEGIAKLRDELARLKSASQTSQK